MARVTVRTDDGQMVGEMSLDTRHGPWTDAWQIEDQYEFFELVNKAARQEGGE